MTKTQKWLLRVQTFQRYWKLLVIFVGEQRALETIERSKLKLFTYGEVTPSWGYQELTPNKCPGHRITISSRYQLLWGHDKTANLINLMKPFGIIIPVGRIPPSENPPFCGMVRRQLGHKYNFWQNHRKHIVKINRPDLTAWDGSNGGQFMGLHHLKLAAHTLKMVGRQSLPFLGGL